MISTGRSVPHLQTLLNNYLIVCSPAPVHGNLNPDSSVHPLKGLEYGEVIPTLLLISWMQHLSYETMRRTQEVGGFY